MRSRVLPPAALALVWIAVLGLSPEARAEDRDLLSVHVDAVLQTPVSPSRDLTTTPLAGHVTFGGLFDGSPADDRHFLFEFAQADDGTSAAGYDAYYNTLRGNLQVSCVATKRSETGRVRGSCLVRGTGLKLRGDGTWVGDIDSERGTLTIDIQARVRCGLCFVR